MFPFRREENYFLFVFLFHSASNLVVVVTRTTFYCPNPQKKKSFVNPKKKIAAGFLRNKHVTYSEFLAERERRHRSRKNHGDGFLFRPSISLSLSLVRCVSILLYFVFFVVFKNKKKNKIMKKASSTGVLKLWDLSRREPKQVVPGRQYDALGSVCSVKVNATGSKLAIICHSADGKPLKKSSSPV